MSRKRHYVNNPDLHAALIEYQAQVKKAEDEGKEIPVIPRYIGEAILQIATKLSNKGNFINYPFKEEMILDGVENAIAYGVRNFDTSRTNPFAYFTQIIYYAFLRRIEKEKKQLYIKHKVTQNSVINGEIFSSSEHSNQGSADYVEMDSDYMSDFVENFEKKKLAKKTKKKGLEKFIDEDNQ